jgi:acyl-CoA reductase-like NAD-dependent aldehyde dehydrogenase
VSGAGVFHRANEDAVLNRVIEVLTFEGGGHTFCMHCEDQAVVRKFALQVPVSRFIVNAPAALGGIGACTGLFPALTLGCGAMGGSSSSNNISPMDLLDVRQVAWGVEEEKHQSCGVDDALVEKITAMILEKLK